MNTIDSLTCNLARYISRDIQSFIGSTESYVKNSSHFIELLKDLRTSENDIPVSFHVVSLFKKVPVNDSVLILRELIQKGLPNYVPDLAELCLKNSYLRYDGEIYSQIEGAAMGSPLSPVIANLFMEKFEADALSSSEYQPVCWLRYVDDTFVIWPHGKEALEYFHEHLNNIHDNIKFTKEIEEDGSLPFLDVLVRKRQDGSLGHSVFRKKTHTDRYLNAASPASEVLRNQDLKTLRPGRF